MFINLIIIAKLIDTKPANVKRMKQINDDIRIDLWDRDEPIIVSVQDYKDFFEKNKKESSEKTDMNHAQQSIGVILMIIGTLSFANGYFMNTTVGDYTGHFYNIGLVSEQNKQLQLGNICFVSGIILVATGKRRNS